MEVVRRNYPELPAPGAPHYQSVRVGNLLFLSGATARDTEAEHGDMAAQTDMILKRMQLIVEASVRVRLQELSERESEILADPPSMVRMHS